MSTSGLNIMTKYKLVFLGDIFVGKSSIISRFMYDTFEGDYQATIGIDFLSKTMEVNGKTVRLQLWDTAGQERFRSLIPNYIRDSSVAIVVFDVTNRQSFASLEQWVSDIRSERGPDSIILIVANKIDMEEERCIPKEEGMAKSKDLGAEFIEMSAKLGLNLDEFSQKLASILPANPQRPSLPVVNSEVITIKREEEPPKPSAAPAVHSDCKC